MRRATPPASGPLPGSTSTTVLAWGRQFRFLLVAFTLFSVPVIGFAAGSASAAGLPQAPNPAVVPDATGESGSLAPQLEPLRPFIGKTWKGALSASTPEKPMVDVSRWERALNGQAIRILHSINDGEYGGETIIYWDSKRESLVFTYFTTAGFTTSGTMKYENGKFTGSEAVAGDESGITEVRSSSEVLPDGRLHSKADYLQNGQWVPGHEVTYSMDPTAQVIFR